MTEKTLRSHTSVPPGTCKMTSTSVWLFSFPTCIARHNASVGAAAIADEGCGALRRSFQRRESQTTAHRNRHRMMTSKTIRITCAPPGLPAGRLIERWCQPNGLDADYASGMGVAAAAE